MQLPEFLQNLCVRLGDYYHRRFGDPNDSHSGDIVLPVDADSKWIAAITLGRASKLIIENVHATNELQYTWNKADPVGKRLGPGQGVFYDDVAGTFYARASLPTESSLLNFCSIGLMVD